MASVEWVGNCCWVDSVYSNGPVFELRWRQLLFQSSTEILRSVIARITERDEQLRYVVLRYYSETDTHKPNPATVMSFVFFTNALLGQRGG